MTYQFNLVSRAGPGAGGRVSGVWQHLVGEQGIKNGKEPAKKGGAIVC